MNETAFILQNQLQEMTIGLIRAEHVRCSRNWRGDHIIPPFSSIGFIVDGEGTMMADREEIHPSGGQLYLLPAKTTQTFYTDARHPYEKYYCHFDLNCRGNGLFDLIQVPLLVDAADPQKAIQLLETMMRVSARSSITSAIKANQAVLDLLTYYLECCPAGSISLKGNALDTPLSSAIAYAEAHQYQDITVQKMAEIAGYHPSHFTKLFHQQMGIAPAQFIIRKKTEHAMEQLTASSRPISEIAEALGFHDPFYFSSFFKKQTGMTPSQYRRAYRKPHQ